MSNIIIFTREFTVSIYLKTCWGTSVKRLPSGRETCHVTVLLLITRSNRIPHSGRILSRWMLPKPKHFKLYIKKRFGGWNSKDYRSCKSSRGKRPFLLASRNSKHSTKRVIAYIYVRIVLFSSRC